MEKNLKKFYEKIENVGSKDIVAYQDEKGKVDFKQMQKIRYSLDDLISQLREQGIKNINDVNYAILENNGKLSVFSDNNIYPMPIIIDGTIDVDTVKNNSVLFDITVDPNDNSITLAEESTIEAGKNIFQDTSVYEIIVHNQHRLRNHADAIFPVFHPFSPFRDSFPISAFPMSGTICRNQSAWKYAHPFPPLRFPQCPLQRRLP